MIAGPKLLTTPDSNWLSHLDEQHIESFYHNPRLYAALKRLRLQFLADLAAPRGFSRQDADGVPDSGDSIEVKQGIYELAVAYQQAVDAMRRPSQAQVDAFYVIFHEFLHCEVPWDGTVPAAEFQAKAEACGHPNALVPALQHTLRVRAAVNSFSGLLRWRKAPLEAYEPCLAWFRSQVVLREAA